MAINAAVKAAIYASTAISAYTAIQQGKYAKAAAESEERQYKENQRMAELEAIEDENARNRELFASEATNRTKFAQMTGADPYESNSFLALRDANQRTAGRDVGAIRLMGASQSYRYGLGAYSSKMSGKAAMIGAYGKAGSALLGGYTDLKKAGG